MNETRCQQLRGSLGAELDHASRHELVQRIADIEERNRELLAEHTAATVRAARVATELAAATADLEAARAANRRFMREANARPGPVEIGHPQSEPN